MGPLCPDGRTGGLATSVLFWHLGGPLLLGLLLAEVAAGRCLFVFPAVGGGGELESCSVVLRDVPAAGCAVGVGGGCLGLAFSPTDGAAALYGIVSIAPPDTCVVTCLGGVFADRTGDGALGVAGLTDRTSDGATAGEGDFATATTLGMSFSDAKLSSGPSINTGSFPSREGDESRDAAADVDVGSSGTSDPKAAIVDGTTIS